MGIADSTFGALFVGLQVAVLCFGASILQTWIFFKNSRHDHSLLKSLVLLVALLGAVHCAVICAGVYHVLVSAIDDPESAKALPAIGKTEAFFAATITLFVRFFYVFRLYVLNRSKLLAIVEILLALTELASVLTLGVLELGQHDTLAFAAITPKLITTAAALGIAFDVIVTAAMLRFLRSCHTTIKSTEALMTSLINYALASGLLTLIWATLMLITNLALPKTAIFSGVVFVQPHLFINSLLALLNARRSLRKLSSTCATIEAAPVGQKSTLAFAMHDQSSGSIGNTDTELDTEVDHKRETTTVVVELDSHPEHATYKAQRTLGLDHGVFT